MFRVVQEVENRTGGAVTLYPYARVYRYGTPQVQGFYILHEGLIGVVGDAGLQEITYSEALGQNAPRLFQSVTGGWLGITDKYWAAALVPNQTTVYRAEFSAGGKKGTAEGEWYQVDYLIPGGVAVPAGERRGVEGLLYAGAKQVKTVERYEEAYGIKQFDLMIDWGWFYFITKPLFYLIDWLYKFLGNFGLAILAVTVIVKALFFPLANKSYESMAKMKKLQPEMERIRERFKDDRARQQQELMSLYQKQKINPLAGCLPILLQIPVFFALYKVLFVTIDMRHAPFYGWIKDLSAPDPTSVFNLFGLLPYAVPEFLHVGAWPLIMGLTMWLQMQLNPPQPDPTQQMIFNWMPVLFTFLLASFPAGLVIYWAWNNVLSLAQQWYISKKQGADPHLIENLRRHIGTVMGFFGRRGDKGAKGVRTGRAAPERRAGRGSFVDERRRGRRRPPPPATTSSRSPGASSRAWRHSMACRPPARSRSPSPAAPTWASRASSTRSPGVTTSPAPPTRRAARNSSISSSRRGCRSRSSTCRATASPRRRSRWSRPGPGS